MSRDLDEITLSVATSMAAEPIFKGLDPKIRFKLYKWLYKDSAPEMKTNMLIQKMEELMSTQKLEKNESMFTFYNNGAVKMDFGPNVSDKVKKAAMDWAKRKGLNAVEIPLKKSANSPYTIIFGNKVENASVLKQVRKSY